MSSINRALSLAGRHGGGGHSLGQLLLGVGAQLQQAHQHGRHVHVGLPHGEAAADQVDGGAADGAVGGQLRAGGLQEQERQRLAWEEERTAQNDSKQERARVYPPRRLSPDILEAPFALQRPSRARYRLSRQVYGFRFCGESGVRLSIF